MSKKLDIIQLGNAILKQQALTVSNFGDKDFQQLIDDLIDTMTLAAGVGLAAPQVGISTRLFVMNPPPNDKKSKPIAVINPEIVQHSKEKEKAKEGCLSVPGLVGMVGRYTTIKAKYFDRKGNPVEIELSAFPARVFQHELDHLDGLVFLDRLTSQKDLYIESEPQKELV